MRSRPGRRFAPRPGRGRPSRPGRGYRSSALPSPPFGPEPAGARRAHAPEPDAGSLADAAADPFASAVGESHSPPAQHGGPGRCQPIPVGIAEPAGEVQAWGRIAGCGLPVPWRPPAVKARSCNALAQLSSSFSLEHRLSKKQFSNKSAVMFRVTQASAFGLRRGRRGASRTATMSSSAATNVSRLPRTFRGSSLPSAIHWKIVRRP